MGCVFILKYLQQIFGNLRLGLIFRTHCFHGTCYYEDDAFIYGAGSIRAEDVAAKKFDAIVEKVGLSDAECRMCCPWKFYG